MPSPERRPNRQQGLFDNQKVMGMYGHLRKDAAESQITRAYVNWIENSGPTIVIDPEVALGDLDNTLQRVRIAATMGMKVMELGGSTNKNDAAKEVIPLIRKVVDDVGSDTLLVSFPGTSDQVVEGVHATYSLFLPQLDGVFKENPQIAEYFNTQYFEIIDNSQSLGVPVIPMPYILFNAGKPTTVERTTGIQGINVQDGVDTTAVMNEIAPWLGSNDLVMLEVGSAPERSVNLGGVAKEVYGITGVHPIVTGGVASPDIMRAITQEFVTPVVVGSTFERTPPEEFGKLYQAFRNAHPSCNFQ